MQNAQSFIYKRIRIYYYLSCSGERGEGVNTPGCEPGMREFDSHRSPQTRKLQSIKDCFSFNQLLFVFLRIHHV